jgi:hypothetical protein
MSEDRPVVTLEYLAEQQRRMLADQRTMIDDINVLSAIVRRLDNTQGALLEEMRAIHALLAPRRRPRASDRGEGIAF